jgi:hypothetical protein
MDLFGAHQGYLVSSRASSLSNVVGQKLSITFLTAEKLYELEKSHNIEAGYWFGSYDPKMDEKIIGFQKSLKKKCYKEYFYIRYRYWLDEPHQQLKRLVSAGKVIRKKYKILTEDLLYLIYESVILFSLATLSFSRRLFPIPVDKLSSEVVSEWHGGRTNQASRENLVNEIHKYIKTFIEEHGIETQEINISDFPLEPDYVSDNLSENVARIINNSKSSCRVPQFLDATLYGGLLMNRSFTNSKEKSLIVKEYGFRREFIDLIAKNSKDIVKLYTSATELDDSIFEDLYQY